MQNQNYTGLLVPGRDVRPVVPIDNIGVADLAHLAGNKEEVARAYRHGVQATHGLDEDHNNLYVLRHGERARLGLPENAFQREIARQFSQKVEDVNGPENLSDFWRTTLD